MSTPKPNRKIVARLDALLPDGATYELALGKRHWRVLVGGKLVGILPMSPSGERCGRNIKNVASQIVRAHKGLRP